MTVRGQLGFRWRVTLPCASEASGWRASAVLIEVLEHRGFDFVFGADHNADAVTSKRAATPKAGVVPLVGAEIDVEHNLGAGMCARSAAKRVALRDGSC